MVVILEPIPTKSTDDLGMDTYIRILAVVALVVFVTGSLFLPNFV